MKPVQVNARDFREAVDNLVAKPAVKEKYLTRLPANTPRGGHGHVEVELSDAEKPLLLELLKFSIPKPARTRITQFVYRDKPCVAVDGGGSPFRTPPPLLSGRGGQGGSLAP